MATLCRTPSSSLPNAIVNGSPAGTSTQAVSNARLRAVSWTTPPTASVQSPPGWTTGGAPAGSGLGAAIASSSISPYWPTSVSSCSVSYHARNAVEPSSVTSTDGMAPLAVSGWVSTGLKPSSPLDANTTPSSASSQESLSV